MPKQCAIYVPEYHNLSVIFSPVRTFTVYKNYPPIYSGVNPFPFGDIFPFVL